MVVVGRRIVGGMLVGGMRKRKLDGKFVHSKFVPVDLVGIVVRPWGIQWLCLNRELRDRKSLMR